MADENTQSAPVETSAAPVESASVDTSTDTTEGVDAVGGLLDSFRGEVTEAPTETKADPVEASRGGDGGGKDAASPPITSEPDEETKLITRLAADPAYATRLHKALSAIQDQPQTQGQPKAEPETDEFKPLRDALKAYDPELAKPMNAVIDRLAKLESKDSQRERAVQDAEDRRRAETEFGQLRDGIERRFTKVAGEYGEDLYGAGPNREITDQRHKEARMAVASDAYALYLGSQALARQTGTKPMTLEQAIERAERGYAFEHVRGIARKEVNQKVDARNKQRSVVPGAAPKSAVSGTSGADAVGVLLDQYLGKR